MIPDGRDWRWGKLGPALVGRAMFSKSLIQISADGWGCALSCEVTQSWNALASKCTWNVPPKRTYANTHFQDCCCQCPCPYRRPLLTHSSTGDPQTLTGKSGSVSCGVTVPFSWVLVCTKYCLCPPRVCFWSPVEVL